MLYYFYPISCFQMRNPLSFKLVIFFTMYLYSLAVLKIFFFAIRFQKFNCDVSWYVLHFGLFYFEFTQLRGSIGFCLSPVGKIVTHYFFWDSNNANVRYLLYKSLRFFFFQSISFLMFRLNKFYWFVFKFMNVVLCHLHSAVDSTQQVLKFKLSYFWVP